MNHSDIFYSRSTSDKKEFARRFAIVQDQIRKGPDRIGLPSLELAQRYVQIPLPIRSEFWILSIDGKDRGRISAHLSPFYHGNGYLGFFEADSFDSARLLLEQGEAWLRNQGVQRILGPINYNTWLSYRFRINSDDSVDSSAGPFTFEPIHPCSYPVWWKELGFQIVARYHSDGLDGIDEMVRKTQADYENALKNGFSFRKMNPEQLLEKEVPLLYEISMQAFQNNYLFEPVPFDFFRELYVPFAKKFDSNLAYFVCNRTGKEIGYFFNFIESGYFVLKTTAILPENRGNRLSNALLHPSVREAQARGIKKTITALMYDGIQSESYSKKQIRIWRHQYVLFGKTLSQNI